jgi:membrane associated rhomboid family serine protease
MYSQNPYGGRVQVGLGMTPGVKYLLIGNAVAYLLELIAPEFFVYHFGLIPDKFAFDLHLWTPLSYMFMHAPNDPGHIMLNMLGLWMFGVILERRWGMRSFLQFYLVAGLIAAFFVIISGFLFGTANLPTIGASGAILALLMAFGLIFPNEHIYFYFLFPVRARHFLIFIVGMTALYAITGASGSTSIPAHAGGLFAGWFLIRGYYQPQVARKAMRKALVNLQLRLEKRKRKSNLHSVHDEDEDRRDPPGGYYN